MIHRLDRQVRAHRHRGGGHRARRIDDRRRAHASEKSDCESKGGTYTQTEVTWNGKTGTTHSCCIKDAATNTTSCTSTTVTKNVRIPVTVRPGVIETVENIEPANVEPAPPIQRVPLEVLTADAQIQPAP